MKYHTYDLSTGQLLQVFETIPAAPYVDGEWDVDNEYVEAGIVSPRTPIQLTFDKTEAVQGETITVSGVPLDGFLVYEGAVTLDRSFTIVGRSVQVGLLGKYVGGVKCIRITLEQLRAKVMFENMVAEFKNTPVGQAVVAAATAADLRALYP